MTIIGPAEYGGRINAYLCAAQSLNWPVILALSLLCLPIAFFYNQPSVRPALYVLSACLPGYLLLLVARRRQYVLNQPIRAFALSCLYALLVFAFIFICRLTGRLSSATAIAAIGMAWFVGFAFPAKSDLNASDPKQIAGQHWHYGKWLFGSAILAIGVADMQTILLSMLVDLKSAGALRALMNFVTPLAQLLTVLSVYALPRLSSRAAAWGSHRFLKQALAFPAVMIALIAVYLGILTLFAPQLEHLLYGGKMQAYVHWVPLLAASAFVAGIGASFSTLLRAVQNSQHQFIAGITGSIVGLACAFYLLRDLGISGALWSMLAANTTTTLIIIASYFWLLRRSHA